MFVQCIRYTYDMTLVTFAVVVVLVKYGIDAGNKKEAKQLFPINYHFFYVV